MYADDRIAAEAFGGYSLVWPLFVAANADTVPQAQRDWLFGRLSVIGSKFGLSSAQVLVLARRHVLGMQPSSWPICLTLTYFSIFPLAIFLANLAQSKYEAVRAYADDRQTCAPMWTDPL
jgi:hypothetical protein